MNQEKRIADLREAYLKALEFGAADLNQSVRENDPTAYYNAIVRHEKLTKGVIDGLGALFSIENDPPPHIRNTR